MTSPAPSPLVFARAYVAAGYSVLPVGRTGDKRPCYDRLPFRADPNRPDRGQRSWAMYQAELADEPTLAAWFADGNAGPAVIGGAVSGGLACLDVESTAVADDLRELLEQWQPGLWARLPRVRTPGQHSTDGGIHLWFRFANPGEVPNAGLAKRPRDDGSLTAVIEMRCEGKYWLAPGCPADCHPLNKPYIWDATSPKLTLAPLLDAAELDALVTCARSLDRSAANGPAVPVPTAVVGTGTASLPAAPAEPAGLTPLDDYDRRGPAWGDAELLGGLGWREVGSGRWRAPQKTHVSGWSATTTNRSAGGQVELLHVFSPNAPPFADGRTYGKGRAYAMIRHKGDLSAAARDLGGRGYGDRSYASVPVKFGHAGAAVSAGSPTAAPAGAGPGAADSGPEPWQAPLPLDTLSDPPPIFPLHVFPSWLRDTVKGIAAAIPCPVDYPAGFALGIAGGMIGASVSLRIKGDWTEVPSLYLCAIGRPGSGKSPALKAMMKPVVRLHRDAMHKNETAVYVSDVTTEKLAGMLKDQPRGFLLSRDELTAWMHSLDQYKAKGSGSDRQFYLSAWSGDPINQLRKNPDSPPVFVPHPCLTVVGGTQPDVVAAFRGHNDGFSDRILFCYPESVRSAEERWTTPTKEHLAAWDAAVESLYRIPMTVDMPGKPGRPWFLDLNDDAKREWEKLYRWVGEQQADRSTPDYLVEPIQKLTNYVPRFAVVLHILANLPMDPSEIMQPRDLPPVGRDAMAGAATLARYFLDHAARAYGAMRTSPRLRLMRKIVTWLFEKKVTEFTIRDLHRSLWRNVAGTEEWAEPVRELVKTGYLRYSEPYGQTSGRSKPTVYQVNPDLKPQGDDGDEDDGEAGK